MNSTAVFLQPFIKDLGIDWPVNFHDMRHRHDRLSTSPFTIQTNPTDKTHSVYVRGVIESHNSKDFSQAVQALCLVFLAEKLHPVFGGSMRFEKPPDDKQSACWENTYQRQVALVSAHKILWAEDLRHKIWPNLSTNVYEFVCRKISDQYDIHGLNFGGDKNLLSQLALAVVMSKRFGISDTELTDRLIRLSLKHQEFALNIATLYDKFPILPFDFEDQKIKSDHAIKILEQSFQDACVIFKNNLTVRLTKQKCTWSLS